MLLETATYLGPARVVASSGSLVRLSLPDGERDAFPALSSPYQPVPGDLVLAIGQEGTYYVIGVLAGTGRTVFTAFGDLEFQAPRGKMKFVSSREIDLSAPQVGIRAGRLELIARSVMEKFGDAVRWVKDLFQLRAGRVRQEVEGSCTLDAEQIIERAEKDVRIDGEKIHLG